MKGMFVAHRLQQDATRDKRLTKRTAQHRQDHALQARNAHPGAQAAQLPGEGEPPAGGLPSIFPTWRSSRSLLVERPESSDISELAAAIDDSEGGDALLHGLALSIHHSKWEKLTNNLLQRSNWSRLGDFAKALCTLPEDVSQMFEQYEKEFSINLDDATRLNYYKEFVRSALGASVLRIDEVTSSLPNLLYFFSYFRHLLITSLIEPQNCAGGGACWAAPTRRAPVQL